MAYVFNRFLPSPALHSNSFLFLMHSKTTQRNKQIAMGRKKFNMDPKKVRDCFRFSGLREICFNGSLPLDRDGKIAS